MESLLANYPPLVGAQGRAVQFCGKKPTPASKPPKAGATVR